MHPSDRDTDPAAGGDGWSAPQAGDDRGRWVPGTTPAQAGRWVWLPDQQSTTASTSESGSDEFGPGQWPDEQPTAQLPPPDTGWYETQVPPAAPSSQYGQGASRAPAAGGRGAPSGPPAASGPPAYSREPYPDEASTEQYPRPRRPGGEYPPTGGDAPTEAYRRGSAAGPPQAQPPPGFRPTPRGSHLPPYSEPMAGPPPGARATATPGGAAASAAQHSAASGQSPGTGAARGSGPAPGASGPAPAGPTGPAGGTTTPGRTGPRKLTVTRVAAFRSRELTTRGVRIFRQAAAADGADRSGLTSLTYAVMGNYAVDAALAVALANSLFFAAATAESTGKVLLYLLITVAPFAVIAPLIGPALDKLQHGRRFALAASSFARALLAIVMAMNFDSWVLYPCALGMLVLSKSFSVLKAAITPRVLPPDITLVKTNSRLTVFGLIAGGVAGAVAAGLSWAFGSSGALIFTGLLSIAGGWLCLRIPAWVESTAGEIPVDGVGPKAKRAFPLSVTTTLWANGTIRVETGFLALFIAFVIKSEYSEASGFTQLLLLGVVGAAAGVGGFVGNGLGARLPLSKPETVSILSLAATAVSTLIAVLAPGLATAAVVGLVGSTASSLAKVCLDSVIQHELPEASRASAFGLSETVLQLSWVFGGVVGLLIGGVWSFGHDQVYLIGFSVITVVLTIGLVQSALVRRGRSLFPWLDYSRLTSRLRRTPKQRASDSRKAGQGTTGRTTMDPGTATAAWTAGTPRPPGSSWPAGPPGPNQAWTYRPPAPPPQSPTSHLPTAPPTAPQYGPAAAPGTAPNIAGGNPPAGAPPAGPTPAHRPVRDAGARRPKEQG
ncbi:MAG TPA: MFS transporter [Nakamurella sp.]|nr:MFS transporter [Nakamurella sp.]